MDLATRQSQAESGTPIHFPIGIPRPVASDNFFGVNPMRWMRNLTVVPEGPLAFFHEKYFLPYAESVIAALAKANPNAAKLKVSHDGPFYVFTRENGSTVVHLTRAIPLIPEVRPLTVDDVLRGIVESGSTEPNEDLFDLLDILREDLPAERFDLLRRDFPWIDAVMRG